MTLYRIKKLERNMRCDLYIPQKQNEDGGWEDLLFLSYTDDLEKAKNAIAYDKKCTNNSDVSFLDEHGELIENEH